MATNVGEISYKVSVDTAGLRSGLNSAKKDLDSATSDGAANASKLGGIASKIGTAAVAGAVAVGAAVVKIGKDAVKSFADYEQLVGGVETLFKNSADQVQKYADQAYKTAGLSANQYMSTVTSFSASLLQGLGGDTKKAAEYGNRAVIDMADNANKMGTDIGRIQDAYQGFAKQNYTMLDNLKLGYGGTKTEMERLLKDAEKLTGKKFDVSNFADITEAIHIIQENMGITGTTALEAEKTISGSVNSMKASWQNLLTSIAGGGIDMNDALEQFIMSVTTVVDNVLPVIKRALPNIVDALASIFDSLMAILPDLILDLLPVITKTIVQLTSIIISRLPMVLISLLEGLTQVVDQLAAAIPQLIEVLVKTLTNPTTLQNILKAGITLFMALVKAIPQLIVALAEAIPTIVDNIVEFLTNPENLMMIITAAVEVFMAIVEAVPKILPPLVKAIGSLMIAVPRTILTFVGRVGSAMGGVIQAAINKIGSFVVSIGQAAKNLMKGLWEGILKAKDTVVKKIKEVCQGALNAVKSFFGIKSPSRVMAQMGNYLMEGFEEGIADAGSGVVAEAERVNAAVADAFGLSDIGINPTVGSGSFSNNTVATSGSGNSFGSVVVNQNVVANTPVDMQIINQRLGNAVRRATA